MAGIVIAGAAVIGALRLSRNAQNTPTEKPYSPDDDLLALYDGTGYDAAIIRKDWSSFKGPVQPYHYGPSALIRDDQIGMDEVRELAKGGLDQQKITRHNMLNTFDPYTLPSVHDNVVSYTPAGPIKPDSFQVYRNTPISMSVGPVRDDFQQ